MDSGLSWEEELECALKALATLLRDEKTISAYEVHVSRLVPILLHCITGRRLSRAMDVTKTTRRVDVFAKSFADAAQELPADLDTRYDRTTVRDGWGCWEFLLL